MTLIECSECGHEVSSAAVACPNCGNPISQPSVTAQPTPAPPASQPNVRSTPPTSPVHIGVRPLSFGLSGTVAGFWWAAAVFYGFAALVRFSAWEDWRLFKDGSISSSAADRSYDAASGTFILATLWMLIAGILFIIWFFQAYRSAESHGASGRRWSTGWTIGAWFIPLANFVIPKLVMNEVDRMSNPLAGEPPTDERWKPVPRMAVSDLWWTALLMGTVLWLFGIAAFSSASSYTSTGSGVGYILTALSQTLYVVSAALAGVIALRIGERLRRPHP
jgi:hypothetical protein